MTTKKIETIVDQLNAQVGQEATRSLTELKELRKQTQGLESKADLAETATEQIESQWRRGGEDAATIESYLHAQAIAVRSRCVYEGHATRVKQAERKAVNGSLAVAEVIADAVAEGFPGVNVFTALGELPERPRDADLPAAVIVQKKTTVRKQSGHIAGEVEVFYYKSAVHKALDPEAVESACEAADFNVTVKPNLHFAKADLDRVLVTVHFAVEQLPVLAEIDAVAVGRVGNVVGGSLAGSFQTHDSTVKLSTKDDTQTMTGSHIRVTTDRPGAQMRDSKVVNGERQVTVRTVLRASRVGTLRGGTTLQGLLEKVLENHAGTSFVPGVGVCKDAEVVSVKERELPSSSPFASFAEAEQTFTVDLTYTSRVLASGASAAAA